MADRSINIWTLAILCIVLVAGPLSAPPPSSATVPVITVTRDLPTVASTPGEAIVSLEIDIDGQGPNGLILKEYVPLGWQVTASNPAYTSLDPGSGEIAWVLFGNATATSTTITYTLQVPAAEVELRPFSGYLLFNDANGDPQYVEVSGDQTLTTYYQVVTVERKLPDTYDSPSYLDVELAIGIEGKRPNGLIVSEIVPQETQVISANPVFNSYDQSTREIKWVFIDKEVYPRKITYRLLVPESIQDNLGFMGTVKYNDPMHREVILATQGESQVSFNGTSQLITATRYLPNTCMEGDQVEAKISLYIESGAPNGLILKESVPQGWIVTGADPKYATFDSNTGEIKWLLTGTDVVSRSLSYMLLVPAGDSGTKTFSGKLLYNDVTGNPRELVAVGDHSIVVREIGPGDINRDGSVDLDDAILALKILCGVDTGGASIQAGADVNGDNVIGLAEAAYVLQYVAEMRQ